MKALHYISGDTLRSGYQIIGSSDGFEADNLPWLNNGKGIHEGARVEVSDTRKAGKAAHVWEYQTGRFGVPVIINTEVVMPAAGGRAHGFSEYVMPHTEDSSSLSCSRVIDEVTRNVSFMTSGEFLELEGKKNSEPEEWISNRYAGLPKWNGRELSADWRLALLKAYWKAASLRAFSGEGYSSVHVYLGPHNEAGSNAEDADMTIPEAQRFFCDVIDSALPEQVRKIVSMAAGVNDGDNHSYVYTALQFDITANHPEDECFSVENDRVPDAFSITGAEKAFMQDVLAGKKPQLLQKLLDACRELPGTRSSDITEKLLADYRIWYTLYCIEQCTGKDSDAEEFLKASKLDKEQTIEGTMIDVPAVRSYYLLLRHIRKYLRDHFDQEFVETLAETVDEDLADKLSGVMERNPVPFLRAREDIRSFHWNLLYSASRARCRQMIDLVCMDQAAAGKKPNYIRACIEAKLNQSDNADIRREADERNALFLTNLLESAFAPIIEAECANSVILKNPYLIFMKNPAFADKWVFTGAESRKSVKVFLAGLIREPRHFMLLFSLAVKYFGTGFDVSKAITEDAVVPLEDVKEFFSYVHNQENGFNEESRDLAHRAYKRILQIHVSAMLENWEKDPSNPLPDEWLSIWTSDSDTRLWALAEIFKTAAGKNIGPEECRKAFEKLCSAPVTARRRGETAEQSIEIPAEIKNAYGRLLDAGFDKMLEAWKKDPENDRNHLPSDWLGQMADAAPFGINRLPYLSRIFEAAAETGCLRAVECKSAMENLGKPESALAENKELPKRFGTLLNAICDSSLKKGIFPVEKLSDLMEEVPEEWLDSSVLLKKIFEEGSRAGSDDRMSIGAVTDAFGRLGKYAGNMEGEVSRAFLNMMSVQLEKSMEKKESAKSVSEWLGKLHEEASPFFKTDSADEMARIFSHADSETGMTVDEAKAVFDNLQSYSAPDSLNDSVRKKFTDMISRHSDSAKTEASETFEWICQMMDIAPDAYKQDTKWQMDTHELAARLLFNFRNEDRIKADELKVIQKWVGEGTVTDRRVGQIQEYCNRQLDNNNSDPAVLFSSSFTTIDSSCRKLREFYAEDIAKDFRNDLNICSDADTFLSLVEKYKGQAEGRGLRADDLYASVAREVNGSLNHIFENSQDVGMLIAASEKIPAGHYQNAWKQHLSAKIRSRQTELFNSQKSVGDLRSLRETMQKYSDMSDEMKKAFRMLDEYEEQLKLLGQTSESDLLKKMSDEIRFASNQLNEIGDLRETLCKCLMTDEVQAVRKLQSVSFRHGVAGGLMLAVLTRGRGDPLNWGILKKLILPDEKLNEASAKPFAARNLPALQALFALLDTLDTMDLRREGWAAEMLNLLNEKTRGYLTALRRDRKHCERYGIHFDNAGCLILSDGSADNYQ